MMSFIPVTNILAVCTPVTDTVYERESAHALVCVKTKNPDIFTSGCMDFQPQELSASFSLSSHRARLSLTAALCCLGFHAPLTRTPSAPGAENRDATEHTLSRTVKTCCGVNTHTQACLVSTFVRVNHALHHFDRVVRLKLQGDITYGLHQVGEKVRHLPAVLQQNVAVLSVGEVRVAQVGPGEKKNKF